MKEKYVGDEKERGREHENGLSSIDKTLIVGDARISYSIWEVGGIFSFNTILYIYTHTSKLLFLILCLWY